MNNKPRNTNLEEVFFSVIEQNIFTKPDNSDEFVRIPGKKALINANNLHPISVVSNDYEIVRNKDAYNYGKECLRKLFKLNNNHRVEIFNIIRPETLSFCHMDIICPDKIFEHKKDKFIPFVRITNSYNKLYKLYFRIGVCRSICENGMIFNEDSIKFSFNHLKGSKDFIKFDILENSLENILNKFKSNIDVLIENSFDFDFTFPMLYKYLNVSPDFKPKTEKQQKYIKILNNSINDLTEKYRKALGETFYSVYNIITDISTTGIEDEQLLVTKIHNRQTRAWIWVKQITDLLRAKKFDYEEYLKDYLEGRKN